MQKRDGNHHWLPSLCGLFLRRASARTGKLFLRRIDLAGFRTVVSPLHIDRAPRITAAESRQNQVCLLYTSSAIFDRLVRERESYYVHTLEGDDDMPAHAKSTLTGVELTIPVTQGRLNLGTWQGIYLCEFRNRASGRRIVATLIG